MQSRESLLHRFLPFVGVAGAIVALDQGTKTWVRATITETGPIVVIPRIFRIVHVENPGAAWGILGDATYRMPFFIGMTSLALVAIIVYFSRLSPDHKVLRWALTIIMGGAVGNFIDRLDHQSVTDFLDFFVAIKPVSTWLIQIAGTNRWPAFNVADIAVVVGLFLVIYDSLFLEPRRMAAAEAAQAGDARNAAAAPSGEALAAQPDMTSTLKQEGAC